MADLKKKKKIKRENVVDMSNKKITSLIFKD